MDSSSDEDCYINSASQLKALKKKLVLAASPLEVQDCDDDLTIQDDILSNAPSISLSDCCVINTQATGRRLRKKKANIDMEKLIVNDRHQNKPLVDTVCLSDSDTDDIVVTSPTVDTAVPGDDADENYEMIIKINWRSVKLERITLRKYQQFSKIFDYFAAMENIAQNRIWLVFRNNTTVQPSDTPDSLGFSIVDILEGGIIDGNTECNAANSNVDKDSISIKIQTKDQKKTMNLSIKKNQKIKVLVLKCAEQLAIPENKIDLQFDGESVDPDETAESLDLEGGECFDLHIIP